MKNFVYITTNLINGKQYIGSTIGHDKNYIGGGTYFNKAVKKYGKNNFKQDVLQECETIEQARLLEAFYINKFNTLKPSGYNILKDGGMGLSDSWGNHTNETKQKISKKMKGKKLSKEHIKILSEKRMGKKISEKTKQKISDSLKGRILTYEHIINMSKSKKGRILSEETKNKIRKSLEGHAVSDETKQKIKNKNKGKTLSPEHKKKIGESVRNSKK